ncbi:MAG: tRNA lysidine(34) synthetase TilS [Pseudooceanicola sp.]
MPQDPITDGLLKEVIAGRISQTIKTGLGVAVSGGGDSVALMVLLSDIATEKGFDLRVVTVDHGLRPASAQEARQVASIAATLGLGHDVLTWGGWGGKGNLQDAARRARYDLMAKWARSRGLDHVALGHTAEDQAETVLMRLARASGVDGLSGMGDKRRYRGVTFLRPMLRLRRDDLRAFLSRRGVDWIDDPSNDDIAFDRVRLRKAMPALNALGLTVPRLTSVARNMRDVRDTLDWYAYVEARAAVRIDNGDVVIPLRDIRRLRDEILRRILIRSLAWISGAEYAPRARATALMIETIKNGASMTLNGCIATVNDGALRLSREPNAVSGQIAGSDETWDGRWKISPAPIANQTGQHMVKPYPAGAEIRALGQDGLAQCPDWRDTGLPRQSLLASPALWHGDELIAAPLAGRSNGWSAHLIKDDEVFFTAFLTH